MPKREKGRSQNYVFTVRPNRRADEAHLEGVKKVLAKCNKELKGTDKRLTISKTPRGKISDHSWKYDNRFSHGKRWRVEDSKHCDIYVVVRKRTKKV